MLSLPTWAAALLTPAQLEAADKSWRWGWSKVLLLPQMPLASTERYLVLALAHFMDSDGFARPSLTTLQVVTRLGRTTIARDLRELDVGGYISRVKGGPGIGATQYQATFPSAPPALLPSAHGAPPPTAVAATVPAPSAPGEPLVQGVDHMVHEGDQVVQVVDIPSAPPAPEVGLEVALEVASEETNEERPLARTPNSTGSLEDDMATHDRFGDPVTDDWPEPTSLLDRILAHPEVDDQASRAEGYVWWRGTQHPIEDVAVALGIDQESAA